MVTREYNKQNFHARQITDLGGKKQYHTDVYSYIGLKVYSTLQIFHKRQCVSAQGQHYGSCVFYLPGVITVLYYTWELQEKLLSQYILLNHWIWS